MATRKSKPKAQPVEHAATGEQIEAFDPFDVQGMTDEEALIQAVRNAPGRYTHLRVYQVERTFVSTTGATKHTRRSQLGQEPLTVLMNPGIYNTLSQKYGGGEGVRFDVMLMTANNELGPSKRLDSAIDARPQANAFQGFGGPQSAPFAAPGGFGGAGGMPMMPPPWWTPPAPTKNDNELLLTILPLLLSAIEGKGTATSEGVKVGMEMAKTMQEAMGGKTAHAAIAEAASSGIENIAAMVLANKNSPQRGPRLPPPSTPGDPEHLGWLVVTSIEQDWPVKRTATALKYALGADEIARVLDNPKAIVPLLTTAANAYAPMKKFERDKAALMTWASTVFNHLQEESDEAGPREPDEVAG